MSPRTDDACSASRLSNGSPVLGKANGSLKSACTAKGRLSTKSCTAAAHFLKNGKSRATLPPDLGTHRDTAHCRERRFGSHGFLPWMTWTEASSRTSSSLSVSSSSLSSSVRYTCRSHPDGRPLAVLSRRLTSAGTQLELTPEGWDLLDAVMLTCILVVCGSHDWKRVAGIGVPVGLSQSQNRNRGNSRRQGSIDEREDVMAIGEEMITGLDGWASPPNLADMSPGGSGFLTPNVNVHLHGPRVVGSLMSSVHASPVPSRAPSPPPYLP